MSADIRAACQRSPASRWQFYLEVINLLTHENAAQLTPELHDKLAADRPLLTLSDAALPRAPSFRIRTRP